MTSGRSELGGLEVMLLYVDGCPNWKQAEQAAHQALTCRVHRTGTGPPENGSDTLGS